jgi:hypothetical protein
MIRNASHRLVVILVLTALAFTHASMALAVCAMDRGEMAAASMHVGEDGCDMSQQAAMENANQCLAHCTSDLQNTAQPIAIVRSPGAVPVLSVVSRAAPSAQSKGLSVPPPGAPPHRVLLHSFLI